MDSINRNQPETNRRDLQGVDAVEKIRELVGKAKTCLFSTTGPTGRSAARPMSVRKVDDAGNLWFLSAADSDQNEQMASDPIVDLYFQGSPHSDFMHLTGRTTISRNRETIEQLWDPFIKTWFTEGIDDPRITVVQFTPTAGYYWDTKHGPVVAGAKIWIGAMLGKTLDDSIEGTLQP